MYGLDFRNRSRLAGSTPVQDLDFSEPVIVPLASGIHLPAATATAEVPIIITPEIDVGYGHDFRARDRFSGDPQMRTDWATPNFVFEAPETDDQIPIVPLAPTDFFNDKMRDIFDKRDQRTEVNVSVKLIPVELEEIIPTDQVIALDADITPTGGGLGSIMALPVPLGILALQSSGKIINVAAKTSGGMFGFGGGGNRLQRALAATTGAIAGASILDMLGITSWFQGDDTFRSDEFENMVQELVESDYILWDETDRRGQPREMEYIVVPINGNGQERPYGMAYRPFSRTSMRKRDNAQDTYRRPRSTRRRNRA